MRKQSSGIARNACRLLLLALTVWTASIVLAAADRAGHIVVVAIHDIISPATAEFLHQTLSAAHSDGAALVVIEMDTPGGLDTSMRGIIQDILASPVPVATYVHPEGARAASAGTYILYASHIAAMTPATNLGAATPVALGGGGKSNPADAGSGNPTPATPDATQSDATQSDDAQSDDAQSDITRPGQPDTAVPDKTQPAPADASSAKAVNDAAAYIRSLAQLRGRNTDFAERAVREAASLSAEEALNDGVIDLIAVDIHDLLAQLDGRKIELAAGAVTLATGDADIVYREPGLRHRLLALIANPQIALILMMLGVYGLFYEFTSPGFGVPGVAGLICLVVALYSLHMMPVNWAGMALIVLGIGLMIAEAFVPSFGVFGIGGVIAFIVGGLFLMDGSMPGVAISPVPLVLLALTSGVILFFLGGVAVKSWRRPVVSGREDMPGRIATVTGFQADGAYWVMIFGERWRAESRTPLSHGQRVRIEYIDGLTLHVTPLPPSPTDIHEP